MASGGGHQYGGLTPGKGHKATLNSKALFEAVFNNETR
jgi:hypothetical protein